MRSWSKNGGERRRDWGMCDYGVLVAGLKRCCRRTPGRRLPLAAEAATPRGNRMPGIEVNNRNLRIQINIPCVSRGHSGFHRHG